MSINLAFRRMTYMNGDREGIRMELVPILQSIVLLTPANRSPVLAKRCFGSRFATPVDGGVIFPDGQPVFGPTKTFRGIVASLLVTAAGAPVVGVRPEGGVLAASVAMAGACASWSISIPSRCLAWSGPRRCSSFRTISLSDIGCSASIAELVRVCTECPCLNVRSSKRDAAAYARSNDAGQQARPVFTGGGCGRM
ncbi:hypothetical protein [Enhydrobacter sp.]|uniref:hypothetical protein n=1 Tax=Enhydrobacter sp. TaxID=1894999 RepID=UPI00260EB1A2|nr:hypothetical protein [Enhydrobacter sp.]